MLMVLKGEREMIPVSPAAFTAAQSSKRDLQRYDGALVISREGQARTIEKVEVTGFWGSSLPRKILSALTGAWAIKVHFGAAKAMALDEFKALIIRYLGYDQERGEPYLPQAQPLDVVHQHVRAASSFPEVFQSINVPAPENSLDVL